MRCLLFLNLARFSIGDYQDHFSIQSTSKPFTYALALNHMGAEVPITYMYDLTLAIVVFHKKATKVKPHSGSPIFALGYFSSY